MVSVVKTDTPTPQEPSKLVLPDPAEQPVMELWPEVGRDVLRLSRGLTYAAAAAGEIPTIRVGRRHLVPTAALRRLLGVDPPLEQPVAEPHRITVVKRSRASGT